MARTLPCQGRGSRVFGTGRNEPGVRRGGRRSEFRQKRAGATFGAAQERRPLFFILKIKIVNYAAVVQLARTLPCQGRGSRVFGTGRNEPGVRRGGRRSEFRQKRAGATFGAAQERRPLFFILKIKIVNYAAVVQLARTLPCQGRGRRFESGSPLSLSIYPSPDGGIGRHARLKILWLNKPCRFDPGSGH